MRRLFLVSFWACATAYAQSSVPAAPDRSANGPKEFCALRVRILNEAGFTSTTDLPVFIIRAADDKIVDQQGTSTGEINICDVVPETFHVAIGRPGCGQVLVKDLSLIWGKTIGITAVYQPCILPESLPYYGCMVLLRVRNGNDQPVPHAMVASVTDGQQNVYPTDLFGRYQLAVSVGHRSHLTISAPGFDDEEHTITCSRDEVSKKNERIIVLKSKSSP